MTEIVITISEKIDKAGNSDLHGFAYEHKIRSDTPSERERSKIPELARALPSLFIAALNQLSASAGGRFITHRVDIKSMDEFDGVMAHIKGLIDSERFPSELEAEGAENEGDI